MFWTPAFPGGCELEGTRPRRLCKWVRPAASGRTVADCSEVEAVNLKVFFFQITKIMLVRMGWSWVGEMGLCVDLCAHASGGWGWQKSSSTTPHFILWGRVSQWTQSSWLWLPLLRTPSLQVQVACPAHPAFTWDQGSWTPILPPTQVVLNHWTVLSQPSILFLGFVGSFGWVGGYFVLFSSLLCY